MVAGAATTCWRNNEEHSDHCLHAPQTRATFSKTSERYMYPANQALPREYFLLYDVWCSGDRSNFTFAVHGVCAIYKST